MDPPKVNSETIENASAHDRPTTPVKDGELLMRSREDDLSVWQCVVRFKKVSLIAMLASFSAALDGYRENSYPAFLKLHMLISILEINLNGGIVSNKGFIQQMASPGTTIIAGKYVSAWGGIQSAGQTVGQIVRLS